MSTKKLAEGKILTKYAFWLSLIRLNKLRCIKSTVLGRVAEPEPETVGTITWGLQNRNRNRIRSTVPVRFLIQENEANNSKKFNYKFNVFFFM
jgi:hypothetical protein